MIAGTFFGLWRPFFPSSSVIDFVRRSVRFITAIRYLSFSFNCPFYFLPFSLPATTTGHLALKIANTPKNAGRGRPARDSTVLGGCLKPGDIHMVASVQILVQYALIQTGSAFTPTRVPV